MKYAFYGIKSEGDLQGKGNANARISRQTRYNTNNANKEYWRKSYYWNIGKYRRRPRCIGSGAFRPSTDEHDHLPALRQGNQVKPRKVSICARVIRAFFVPSLKYIHFFCGYF